MALHALKLGAVEELAKRIEEWLEGGRGRVWTFVCPSGELQWLSRRVWVVAAGCGPDLRVLREEFEQRLPAEVENRKNARTVEETVHKNSLKGSERHVQG